MHTLLANLYGIIDINLHVTSFILDHHTMHTNVISIDDIVISDMQFEKHVCICSSMTYAVNTTQIKFIEKWLMEVQKKIQRWKNTPRECRLWFKDTFLRACSPLNGITCNTHDTESAPPAKITSAFRSTLISPVYEVIPRKISLDNCYKKSTWSMNVQFLKE